MSSPARILVVEDDAHIRHVIAFTLRHAGYEVLEAERGDDALALAREAMPDLALLDVMMPGISGLEVCRRLRADDPILPILIVSARGERFDRELGFEFGADDYITKPFSPRELLLRVEARLQRAPGQEERERAGEITIGDLHIPASGDRAVVAGREVPLTPSEGALLRALVLVPRHALTRNQLMDSMGRDEFFGDVRSVDTHMRHLRAKIEDDPQHPRYLHTVRGVGYAAWDAHEAT